MKKPSFRSYWLARTSIALADVVYIMVITTYIYQSTDSALIASLFPLLRALGSLAAGLTRMNEATAAAEAGTSRNALMKEGWLLLWRNRTLRTVTLMDVIEGMAGAIWIGALTLVYVKEALAKGSSGGATLTPATISARFSAGLSRSVSPPRSSVA